MSSEFESRLAQHIDELTALYYSLYPAANDALTALLMLIKKRWQSRPAALKNLDRSREAEPGWYRGNDRFGYCLYVKEFAGNLRGVREKLDYLTSLGVNYIHFMPLLDTVDGHSDGGYSVADFRRVKPELGTMKDLEQLTADCHERGISCCLDFVLNHTSIDHEWAKKARAGDPEYRDYYYFFDNWDIPREYDKLVPQVFPVTAPGNFTYYEDMGKVVMTSFHPYQWDLNYGNPAVFNAMTDNLLYLVNKGIDVIRVDAVPYIWKELGTDCRNRPQVHTIVRMIRLICEIVCPGTLLLGEVVMAPEELAPYFGSVDKPECHMLYNATTMCSTWHTVATRDVRLLRHQLDVVCALPKEYVFLNYLRCHDDIGWGLDFPYLRQFGFEEIPHKEYLNSFFTGEFPGSFARGERYNDDPIIRDARMCGTTASLAGVEAAEWSGDPDARTDATDYVLTLHAFLLTQSGMPMLYAGDEIGQLNDYSYHEDPEKAEDSRYIHRGCFPWEEAELRAEPETRQGKLFQGITKLETVRREQPVFSANAEVCTFDTGSSSVLGIRRSMAGQTLTAVFNFSEYWQHTELCVQGMNKNLMTGENIVLSGQWELPPHGFLWMLM